MISGFKLIEKTAASSNKGSRKQRKSIGVDAFSGPPGDETRILQIARTAATKIRLEESNIQECDVEIDLRWNAGAYGFVDEKTQEALKLMASLEDILTDPVYAGKALAGMIGKARLGEFKGCSNVLFVHTGGVPALIAYPNVR
jgi:1-aminocyclopropane-1-carboxylate deaminase